MSDRDIEILYIEDNEMIIKLMERIVTMHSRAAFSFERTGAAGLKVAKDRHPAMVFLDHHLPDMRGLDVLVALKEDPQTALIPVVILTGDSTAGDERVFIEAGALAHILKPIDPHYVLTLIDSAIGQAAND
jgi:CheY-like chemotaxis protein